MDTEFSPEQDELRASVRRFLDEQAPLRPYVRSMLDDPTGTTDEVWRGLADLGATGLLAPSSHGGTDAGMVTMGVVLEELGRAVHPGPFTSSAVGAVTVLVGAGSPDDHDRWLPGLADGSLVGTVAPAPGRSTTAAIHPPVATPTAAGWTVTGEARLVPDGAAAGLVLVVTDGPDGPVAMAVEPARAGGTVGVEPVPLADGTRRVAHLRFDEAPAVRLGGADPAAALGRAADLLAIAAATDALGAAGRALELAVAYAGERHQFGVPVGSFQAVQHLCAEMLERLELGRAGIHYALWAADAVDPAERHRAATMAKAYAAGELPWVGEQTIQVFGGLGFTWEADPHLFLKRLLTVEQLGGTADDHLDDLADELFG